MKSRPVTWLTPLALAVLVGSAANATMLAGWDFSQYFDVGALSTDGATFTDTLDANYSDLDPTAGAGAESGAFGTMYINGQFGSTNVGPLLGSGLEPIQPTAATGGSLASNLTAPGGVDFDSLTVLLDEGQAFANSLAMIAAGTSVVVFEADLSSASQAGSSWSISFGARTFAGTSSIGIEFSSDGVTFTSFGSVNLTTTDTAFDVVLGADQTSTAYVRLSFNPSGANQPLIDNVAISAAELVEVVPEPSTTLLGSMGLIGLALAGRRRVPRD
jgi:hypothetical protein